MLLERLAHTKAIIVAATTVVTLLVIFLTPIRYSTIIEPSIRDIDPAVVYAAMSQDPEKYLFIDVRTSADYAKLHAQGSVNIPIQFLYDEWRDLPRTGQQIVLICGGGRLSGIAFFFLQHFGFTNIVRIAGGLDHWVAEGLPVSLQETHNS